MGAIGGSGFQRSLLPEGTKAVGPAQITCLLTVHGIGFNQARIDGEPGYADQLHVHLRDAGLALSGDPQAPANVTPLYVIGKARSHLSRLGPSGPALRSGDDRIVHVALVYTGLDGQGFDVRSFLRGSGAAFLHLFSYTTPWGLIRFGLGDLITIIRRHRPDPAHPRPSLRVSAARMGRGVTGRLLPLRLINRRRDPNSGALALLKQLADDVCAYRYRPQVHDRIDDFVQEALAQLAERREVGAIVVNAHSQGTVPVFDALGKLAEDKPGTVDRVTDKLVWWITAGSPLRKYVQLFGLRPSLRNFTGTWTNFYDPQDPVGDPLAPPRTWRLGTPPASPAVGAGLFHLVAAGQKRIEDQPVDNVAKTLGGGLRAHNYWDNLGQFIEPVAASLKLLSGAASPSARVGPASRNP